jgi:hypothetical protein
MTVVHLSPRAVRRALWVIVPVLVLASTAGQYANYYLGHDHVFGAVERFSLDGEGNVPSWYSSTTLLICSVLLGFIAAARRRSGDRWWRHWGGLAAVFLYLSIDEGASLHELAVEPVRDVLGVGGFLYWAWVIPGMAAAGLVALSYRRFVRALPPETRRRFLWAAGLFVGGAIGMEMLSGPWAEAHGKRNAGFAVFFTIEETLEMAAVAIFLYALLRYLQEHVGVVTLAFGEAHGAEAAEGAATGYRPEPPRLAGGPPWRHAIHRVRGVRERAAQRR